MAELLLFAAPKVAKKAAHSSLKLRRARQATGLLLSSNDLIFIVRFRLVADILLSTVTKVCKNTAGDRDFLAYLLLQNRLAVELVKTLP